MCVVPYLFCCFLRNQMINFLTKKRFFVFCTYIVAVSAGGIPLLWQAMCNSAKRHVPVIPLLHLIADSTKNKKKDRETKRKREAKIKINSSRVITCSGLDVECHMQFGLYKRNNKTPVHNGRSPRATRVYTGTNPRP